jgi:hypothetical protein
MSSSIKMETPARSRPFGLLLSRDGIATYVRIFYPHNMEQATIDRLSSTPPRSDGLPSPHLHFSTKKEASYVRDLILSVAGRVDAATHWRA